MTKTSRAIVIVSIVVVIGVVVFLFISYRNAQRIIARDASVLHAFSKTSEIAQFNKMFISKILLNDKQVTFEERLALENSVRKLDDADILNQWNKFVESGSGVTAQDEVKKLLAVLMEKIAGK